MSFIDSYCMNATMFEGDFKGSQYFKCYYFQGMFMKNHIKFIQVLLYSLVWSCGIVAEGEIVCKDQKTFEVIQNETSLYNSNGKPAATLLYDAVYDSTNQIIYSKNQITQKRFEQLQLSFEHATQLQQNMMLRDNKRGKSYEKILNARIGFGEYAVDTTNKICIEDIKSYDKAIKLALEQEIQEKREFCAKICLAMLSNKSNVEKSVKLFKKLLLCELKDHWRYCFDENEYKETLMLKDGSKLSKGLEQIRTSLNQFLSQSKDKSFEINAQHLALIEKNFNILLSEQQAFFKFLQEHDILNSTTHLETGAFNRVLFGIVSICGAFICLNFVLSKAEFPDPIIGLFFKSLAVCISLSVAAIGWHAIVEPPASLSDDIAKREKELQRQYNNIDENKVKEIISQIFQNPAWLDVINQEQIEAVFSY